MKTTDIVWRPTAEHLSKSNVGRFMARHGFSGYDDLIARSIQDIEWFWHACLQDLGVEWYEPYTRVLDQSGGLPWCRWFVSGKLNLVHNCVDRHARNRPDDICLLWEGDRGETRALTYADLDAEVCRLAQALTAAGVGRGDGVGFYMPMVPELVCALLAVLKIGAVAVPVFSAFGADALAVRLQDAAVKLLFTADGSFRRGQAVPIKPAADEALKQVPAVSRSVVLRRTGAQVNWTQGRDVWWEDFIDGHSGKSPTIPLDAEDRCLILYTSGTTGRPKGAVHTHGGVAAQTGKELGYYFDVRPGDRFFWLTDIGWMMGPWDPGSHRPGWHVHDFRGCSQLAQS